jgi:hypothetical protein
VSTYITSIGSTRGCPSRSRWVPPWTFDFFVW